ncbi:MAG: hypothetical protein KC635_01465 [Myxococcales bacterium]|nr:hypothetical protein [Myxococcales bacterium]
MRTLRAALAVALLVGALAAPAGAVTDYDRADADTWNGLGYLLVTAAEAKVDVTVVDALDLATISPDDVLFWIYPTTPLPVDELLAFVGDGGSLIVADDQGSAEPLFAAVGITREPDGPRHQEHWFAQEDGLPVIPRQSDDFLFFNVEELVANHPAALRSAEGGVVAFDDPRELLVVRRELGSGRLLAIGDPSIFLNQMLRRFYGNKQFAANVLRVFCRAEPCHVTLLMPTTTASGSYEGGAGDRGSAERIAEEAVKALNDALSGVSKALSADPVSRLILFGLPLVGAMLVLLALAVWRRPVLTPALGGAILGRSPLVAEAAGLAAARGDADFLAHALTLVDHADALADANAIEAVLAGERPPPRGTTQDAVELVRHALLRVQREAASLRSLQPPVVSAERFARLYDDVRTLNRFGTTR